MAQNWLGLSINFNNVEDKTSEGSGFELLPEGFYRATLKNVIKSVIGANDKPALTITLTLDDENDKEFVHNLFLPENGDTENAIKFKNENLRNFFTRFIYKDLTKEEYKNLSSDEVNNALNDVMINQPNFAGAKMLVHIKQDPFIAVDQQTKAIKFTDLPISECLGGCTKALLKLIQDKEKSGIVFDKMPVFLFSNKVAAHGFGFYNDYDKDIELKNSKSYDYIQSLNVANVGHSGTTTTSEVPMF